MQSHNLHAIQGRVSLRSTSVLLGLAAAVMLAAIAVSTSTSHATRPIAAACETPDATASDAIRRLLGETSAFAEGRARDAMFRLQRARKNCRLGLVTLAQRDYDAISDSRAGRYNRYR